MNNYVRWHRVDDELQVQVAEFTDVVIDSLPTAHSWKSYKLSKNYVPDTLETGYSVSFKSKGFRTFQNCVKQGYKVVDVNGKVI
jgi:hypothetical protein